MDPKIRELQAKLKALGLYTGPVDGKDGPLTQEAAAKFQAAEQQRATEDRDAQARMQEIEARKAEAEAAKAQAETQRVQAENDPTSRITRMATEAAPYVGGMGIGTALGRYGFGKPFEAADEEAGKAGARLAAARNIDPLAKEQQLDRMARGRNIRNVAQFGAPAVLGGAGYATREFIAPMFSDPAMQDLVKNIGTGENAAAVTLGVHQLIDTLRRGNPVDPVDEAQIRSDAARAHNPAPAPGRLAQALTPDVLPPVPPKPEPVPVAPSPPEPPEEPTKQRHRDRLVSAAKEAGASGPLTKAGAAEHLLANIDDSNRGTIARSLGVSNGPNLHKRLLTAIKDMAAKPGASAILAGLAGAAAAGTDPAEAADGSGSNGFKDRAIAGGTAAGTAYGVSKLAQALGPIASGALATGGTMMAPMAAADAYDPTPTQLLKDRVRGAELLRMVLPESLAARLGGAMENAYQMAQVPARGDRSPAAYRARDEADIAADREALAQEMPLPQASALTIPEGIPAPNPDGSSPFPEDAASANPAPYSPFVMGRLSRMQKFGASPEQIAHFLNQAVR